MNIFSSYLFGFKETLKRPKLWLLLYAINLFFAIVLAYPLSIFLEKKLGHTLAADVLLERFDFAIANDFVNQHGDTLGYMLNQSLVVLFLYLILSIFLTGGILNVFKHGQENIYFPTFWKGCSKFFWRMLRLTLYFLFFQGIVFFIFFMLFSFLTKGGLNRFHNERDIIQIGLILLPFYLLFASIVFMIQDYAKIHIVQEDKPIIFRPILQSLGLVFRNFFPAFFLYLLNLLTFLFFFLLYWNLEFKQAIGLTFLFGQIFILIRIGLKLLNLGSAMNLYKTISSRFSASFNQTY